jgi:hypothetical protein
LQQENSQGILKELSQSRAPFLPYRFPSSGKRRSAEFALLVMMTDRREQRNAKNVSLISLKKNSNNTDQNQNHHHRS